MSTRKERLLARHKEVRKEFMKLRDAKELRHNAILDKLSRKYHYSIRRIEDIIAKDDNDPLYGPANQLNLFK